MPKFGEQKEPEQLENQAEGVKEKKPAFSLSKEDLDLDLSLWELGQKYGEENEKYFFELRRKALIDKVSKEIDSHEFKVEELDKIEQVFIKDVALKLIEKGEIKFLKKNIEKFQYQGLDKKVALKLIEIGETKLVAEKLWYFKSLDKEVALKLIEMGESEAVGDKLSADVVQEFKGLDKEVALKLIENGQGEHILYNLRKFTGLDKDVAIKLIKKYR